MTDLSVSEVSAPWLTSCAGAHFPHATPGKRARGKYCLARLVQHAG